MHFVKNLSAIFLFMLLIIGGIGKVEAIDGFHLYTPYTGISVAPGETIEYDMELINDTNSMQQATVTVDGIDWSYVVTSSGWEVDELTVPAGESQSFTLEIDIPLEIDSGTHTFQVRALNDNGPDDALSLSVTVKEEVVSQTEFSSEQPNLEGDADTEFQYKATLRNRTSDEQLFALQSRSPEGWAVRYEVGGESVSSVAVPANDETSVTIIVTPANNVEAGTYPIEVTATSGQMSGTETLEANITGRYDMILTTTDERLNANVTVGGSTDVDFVVENTGTNPITGLTLSSQSPANWTVEFDPEEIPIIEPGESAVVRATITASNEAIAGDYMAAITAQASQVEDSVDLRISVQRPVIWGWVSVGIIIAVMAGIYVVIRRYGRR